MLLFLDPFRSGPLLSPFYCFLRFLCPLPQSLHLSRLHARYIFTHDSVGVGEDGPTHQPVETVSGLRVIPNLDVMRPADYEETAAAYAHSVARTTGPTALILTRQNVPQLDCATPQARRSGALKGGYVLLEETAPLVTILMAAGSEVQYAVAAAAELGPGTRVVSMPCLDVFDRQPKAYRDAVLPPTCAKRVAMEAGVSGLWHKYVGLHGAVHGIDRFGFSAPGDITFRELKMTAKDLAAVARAL